MMYLYNTYKYYQFKMNKHIHQKYFPDISYGKKRIMSMASVRFSKLFAYAF